MYSIMLRSGEIRGEDVCLALWNRVFGVRQTENMENCGTAPECVFFFAEQIRTLAYSGQLALISLYSFQRGSRSGYRRGAALVTYPGYDNNRLANHVDGDYYDRLLNDSSLPLYNNATQQRTAPGSTFKPVTVWRL